MSCRGRGWVIWGSPIVTTGESPAIGISTGGFVPSVLYSVVEGVDTGEESVLRGVRIASRMGTGIETAI
jgi:hypothetical protein